MIALICRFRMPQSFKTALSSAKRKSNYPVVRENPSKNHSASNSLLRTGLFLGALIVSAMAGFPASAAQVDVKQYNSHWSGEMSCYCANCSRNEFSTPIEFDISDGKLVSIDGFGRGQSVKGKIATEGGVFTSIGDVSLFGSYTYQGSPRDIRFTGKFEAPNMTLKGTRGPYECKIVLKRGPTPLQLAEAAKAKRDAKAKAAAAAKAKREAEAKAVALKAAEEEKKRKEIQAHAQGKSEAEQARKLSAAKNSGQAVEELVGSEGRKLIQYGLKDLGFLKGKADGSFGVGTRKAIAAYQLSKNVLESRFLTADQASSLKARGKRLAQAEALRLAKAERKRKEAADRKRIAEEQRLAVEAKTRRLEAEVHKLNEEARRGGEATRKTAEAEAQRQVALAAEQKRKDEAARRDVEAEAQRQTALAAEKRKDEAARKTVEAEAQRQSALAAENQRKDKAARKAAEVEAQRQTALVAEKQRKDEAARKAAEVEAQRQAAIAAERRRKEPNAKAMTRKVEPKRMATVTVESKPKKASAGKANKNKKILSEGLKIPKLIHRTEYTAPYRKARKFHKNKLYNKAYKVCRDPAKNGDGDCQNLLGIYYLSTRQFKNIKLKYNEKLGWKLLKAAAKNGSGSGKLNLAVRLSKRLYTHKKVDKLLHEIMEMDNATTELRSQAFALYLTTIPATPREYDRARLVKYLTKAAGVGVIRASRLLYKLYSTGLVRIGNRKLKDTKSNEKALYYAELASELLNVSKKDKFYSKAKRQAFAKLASKYSKIRKKANGEFASKVASDTARLEKKQKHAAKLEDQRNRLKALDHTDSPELKKAIEKALQAWNDYEKKTWTVAVIKTKRDKRNTSFEEAANSKGNVICGYNEGMRYFYDFAKPTGALKRSERREKEYSGAPINIWHPKMRRSRGKKAELYSPDTVKLEPGLFGSIVYQLSSQGGGPCQGIIIRIDEVDKVSRGLKKRFSHYDEMIVWKDVNIFDPVLKTRAENATANIKNVRKQVAQARAAKKARRQARADAMKEESAQWTASIAKSGSKAARALQAADGDILVFLNTKSNAFKKKRIVWNLKGKIAVRKTKQALAIANGVQKRVANDQVVKDLLYGAFGQRKTTPTGYYGIFVENEDFQKPATLNGSYAIVVIGSEDLSELAAKPFDKIVGARRALVRDFNSGALIPWFKVTGKSIRDAHGVKVAKETAERNKVAEAARKKEVLKNTRKENRLKLTAELEAGSLRGYGLLVRTPFVGKSKICTADRPMAKLFLHYRKHVWSGRPTEVPSGNVLFADIKTNFPVLMDGKCMAIFESAKSLKLIMNGLRRNGVKFVLFSEWIDPQTFAATSAKIEKADREELARAAAERAERRKEMRRQRAEEHKGYPYVARIFCSYPAGRIPYYSCMEKMRLRVDGHTENIALHQIINGGKFKVRGNELLVPLSKSFEIRIQNTDKSDVVNLDLVIEDRNGNTVHQDQAARYRSVAVRN